MPVERVKGKRLRVSSANMEAALSDIVLKLPKPTDNSGTGRTSTFLTFERSFELLESKFGTVK